MKNQARYRKFKPPTHWVGWASLPILFFSRKNFEIFLSGCDVFQKTGQCFQKNNKLHLIFLLCMDTIDFHHISIEIQDNILSPINQFRHQHQRPMSTVPIIYKTCHHWCIVATDLCHLALKSSHCWSKKHLYHRQWTQSVLFLLGLSGLSVVSIIRLKVAGKLRRWRLMVNFIGSGQV